MISIGRFFKIIDDDNSGQINIDEFTKAEYNVTHLNNGFTVLTESQTFPGAVNMGKYSRRQRGPRRSAGR